MTKLFTVMSLSAFLVFSGISALAGQGGSQDRMKSDESQSMENEKGMGSSIESQNPSGKSDESAQQKAARPGEAGEEGTTSIFGSPSTLPPGENSPGYTEADKELEKREKNRQQGMGGPGM